MLNTILAIVVIVVVLFLLFKIFKVIIRLILIAIFLLIAYITNPDRIAHQNAVQKKARKTNTTIRSKAVRVNDFKIFSLTYITEKQDEKLVGVGMFTKVWIFSSPEKN